MSEIQELMAQLPVAQIARQAGVDEADAQRAIQSVLPALVGGMQANAQDDAGAASLERALGKHAGALDARLGGDVDADDGERIVQHVFGGQTDQVAAALGGASGGGAMGDIVKKILPIVAPIVLAWLAQRLFSGGGQAQTQPSGGGAALPTGGDNPFANSGGGAGGTLPRTSGQAPQQSGGGGLGDLLGGILGNGDGGQQQAGGNILGDLLGGLLGGGRR
ncbi:DUF937 domain-containing protein [Agrococcus jejuensis]|uniref:DUF937 domain-containing protein n=1 Tax=Agrococcus jejuensis TaxID=399736 RepID=A0A1G8FUP9_9MICO|nr:DUF937 domain-containing protein [Agrococcus jejuensis]SDH85848.1 protein of unknown function [Agrococcus jejuensis]